MGDKKWSRYNKNVSPAPFKLKYYTFGPLMHCGDSQSV